MLKKSPGSQDFSGLQSIKIDLFLGYPDTGYYDVCVFFFLLLLSFFRDSSKFLKRMLSFEHPHNDL